jgi:predicted XRE-type DNA-binding protein
MASSRNWKRRILTPADAAKIKHLANTTPMFQHEIAAALGLNQGRVSEVLSGKRFKSVSPHP